MYCDTARPWSLDCYVISVTGCKHIRFEVAVYSLIYVQSRWKLTPLQILFSRFTVSHLKEYVAQFSKQSEFSVYQNRIHTCCLSFRLKGHKCSPITIKRLHAAYLLSFSFHFRSSFPVYVALSFPLWEEIYSIFQYYGCPGTPITVKCAWYVAKWRS